jgi:hypothetical protein
MKMPTPEKVLKMLLIFDLDMFEQRRPLLLAMPSFVEQRHVVHWHCPIKMFLQIEMPFF